MRIRIGDKVRVNTSMLVQDVNYFGMEGVVIDIYIDGLVVEFDEVAIVFTEEELTKIDGTEHPHTRPQ